MNLFSNSASLEAGVDEVGRGSLLGRLYVGAVIFPADIELDEKIVKDSKKFTSRLKRSKARDYIFDRCLTYGISYCEAAEIDDYGLSKCLTMAMHKAIDQLDIIPNHLTIDGRIFEPYSDPKRGQISYTCIDKADQKYSNVAAASIIAKVAHDEYIMDLVDKHPILKTYDIHHNMGYGAKIHMDTIKTNGITEFHRKTFGICKAKTFVKCLI